VAGSRKRADHQKERSEGRNAGVNVGETASDNVSTTMRHADVGDVVDTRNQASGNDGYACTSCFMNLSASADYGVHGVGVPRSASAICVRRSGSAIAHMPASVAPPSGDGTSVALRTAGTSGNADDLQRRQI
jgi:hypothetical protein